MKKYITVKEEFSWEGRYSFEELQESMDQFKKKNPNCKYEAFILGGEMDELLFVAKRLETYEEYQKRIHKEELREEEERKHREQVKKDLEESTIKKILTKGLSAVAVCQCFSCGYSQELLENEVVEDCLNCGSTKFQIKTAIKEGKE